MSDLRGALAKVEELIRRDPACFNLSDELQSVRAAIRAALAQSQNDLLQDDLKDMLRALGMFDGAQPKSPHQVFKQAIAEMKRQLAAQPQNDRGAVADWSVEPASE